MYLVTAQEMRELDRLTIEQYGTPSHVLMERAGMGATAAILDAFPHVKKAPVIVVAGKGNNGGDGLVVARLLKKKKISCEVLLTAKKAELTGDAQRNLDAFLRLRGRVTEITEAAHLDFAQEKLNRCGLIVDALLGTGIHSPVQGLLAAVIDLINTSGAPVVAMDIPSGLDADRGEALGTAIQAELTVTFGYAKLGQVCDSGASHVGRLAIVDIGIASAAVATVQPRLHLLTKEEAGALIRSRSVDAHKGDFGHLLVLAGARGKSGAALLCASAALRVGTGLVTLAGPSSLNAIFSSVLLEAMTLPLPERADGSLLLNEGALTEAMHGKSALAFGPGIGVSTDTIALTQWLLTHSSLPLVIDADGLNCLAQDCSILERVRAPVILTPHPGEMARLINKSTTHVQSTRVEVALGFARQHHCYVILKGARTVIAAPDGRGWINPTGNPGMASGGMGDVLTGILGGLLAQGYAAEEACSLAVFLHGHAGDTAAQDLGETGILAHDVIARLPRGLQGLQQAATEGNTASDL